VDTRSAIPALTISKEKDMNEIHVLFPESGPPIASQNQQAVLGNQQIAWYVQSANEEVKQVRITFDAADANFFEIPDPKSQQMLLMNAYQKPLDYVTVDAETKNRIRFTGSTLIYGKAPVPLTENERRDDKYTITGLDTNGNPIDGLELDPFIVTDTP
jgi:hypothetical protein